MYPKKVIKPVRHVLGLSGGKDSAALAIYMRDRVPNMEYFFCDTGCELPETYDFLNKLKDKLGIKITYLNEGLIEQCDRESIFKHWLAEYNGFLPSPMARWCTRVLKIKPLENFIGGDEAISYIAIRADENRDGYVSPVRSKITAVYPFIEDGIKRNDVIGIIEDSGIGMPEYYKWRSRSGCYFCFFQRKIEWVGLYDNHPELFERAVRYESEHADGRTFTWTKGETLLELIGRREQIISNYKKRLSKKELNMPLLDIMEKLDKKDGIKQCLACHS